MVQESESVAAPRSDNPDHQRTKTNNIDGSCLKLSLARTTRSAFTVIETLEGNPSYAHSVTSVVISSNYKHESLVTPKDLIVIFDQIGKLCPSLESLRVAFETHVSVPLTLPVAALVALFRQKPNCLKSLQLSAVVEAEDVHDFALLEEAIRANASDAFQELSFEFCEPASGTPSLDPLVRAFASATSLEEVKLSGTSITHSGICTGPSIEKLLHSNRLQILTIWGGKRRLQPEHICSLARNLNANTSLKELTIHAQNLCPLAGRALAQSLVRNTSLERLVLNVSDSPLSSTHSDYVMTTTMIAKALKYYNRTLKVLSLDYSSSGSELEEETGDSLDYDFYEYDQMHKVTFWWHVNAVIQAFTQMLHCNPVLEVLWMNHDNASVTCCWRGDPEDDGCEEEFRNEQDSTIVSTSEIDMLLRLNRNGIRRNLFGKEGVTSKDWMEALISEKGDLNALYYLISRNPSLCCNLPDGIENKRTSSPSSDEEFSPAPKRLRISANSSS